MRFAAAGLHLFDFRIPSNWSRRMHVDRASGDTSGRDNRFVNWTNELE